ncbi:MAG: protein translocase subunit SecF [Firmicutes bacterium]|nr:protein translocase subunit SecF [Bacillota bacterium]
MSIFQFHFTTSDAISMAITIVILLAVCIWVQTFRKKQYDFMGKIWYFFIFSGIIILISAFSLATKHFNYGLDFTGGTILEVAFERPPSAEDIRGVLTGYNPDLSDAVIQISEESGVSAPGQVLAKKALIRTKELQPKDIDSIVKALNAKFGNLELKKQETVGPIIGNELKQNALLAILIALGIQLVYITFRFGIQMRYGLAADIAMAHDVVVMVGIYSVVGRQVDSPFLAALLTVIGYSVMDSIVIFDRIRENLKLMKKGVFQEVVNTSVNQTMTRSVNTLMTVLITLFALYYFGGPTLKNFAFALLVGVTSGAYSSVFIASPLLIIFDNMVKKGEQERVLARRAALQAAEDNKLSEKAKKAVVPSKVSRINTPLEEDYPGAEDLTSASSESDDKLKARVKARARRKAVRRRR